MTDLVFLFSADADVQTAYNRYEDWQEGRGEVFLRHLDISFAYLRRFPEIAPIFHEHHHTQLEPVSSSGRSAGVRRGHEDGHREMKTKPYRVDFWDSFDRSWVGLQQDFEDLAEAVALCDQMQAELPQGNKDCGEHYGVIDLRLGREVYCGQHGRGSGTGPAD